jgi:hypothetical protein
MLWRCIGSRGIPPPFLTSALDGGEWSASCPSRSTHRETVPNTHWIGGWVGLRGGLEAVEKKKNSCPCRESKPAISPSLYRVSEEIYGRGTDTQLVNQQTQAGMLLLSTVPPSNHRHSINYQFSTKWGTYVGIKQINSTGFFSTSVFMWVRSFLLWEFLCPCYGRSALKLASDKEKKKKKKNVFLT